MKTLIKDIIIIVLLGGLAFLMLSQDEAFGTGLITFLSLAVAGIPFGWRWASKIISAVSFKGVLIKLGFSALLGCIAIFVVVIGDIIRCFKEKTKKMEATN